MKTFQFFLLTAANFLLLVKNLVTVFGVISIIFPLPISTLSKSLKVNCLKVPPLLILLRQHSASNGSNPAIL